MHRTHTCGELNKKNVDKKVTLSGWVSKPRDHGGVIFIDLRDRYGLTQAVFNPEIKDFSEAEKLRREDVIKVIEDKGEQPTFQVKEIIKLTGMRKIIADRLGLSAKNALNVPLTMEVDMTEIVKIITEIINQKNKKLLFFFDFKTFISSLRIIFKMLFNLRLFLNKVIPYWFKGFSY